MSKAFDFKTRQFDFRSSRKILNQDLSELPVVDINHDLVGFLSERDCLSGSY